jgi:xyloglucan-specific exo-beta-1,4-glucanase
VYLVGVINGVWGVYGSDNGGSSWSRINDDQHQFGGIGVIAADQNIAGRLYIAGSGRGILFNN